MFKNRQSNHHSTLEHHHETINFERRLTGSENSIEILISLTPKGFLQQPASYLGMLLTKWLHRCALLPESPPENPYVYYYFIVFVNNSVCGLCVWLCLCHWPYFSGMDNSIILGFRQSHWKGLEKNDYNLPFTSFTFNGFKNIHTFNQSQSSLSSNIITFLCFNRMVKLWKL